LKKKRVGFFSGLDFVTFITACAKMKDINEIAEMIGLDSGGIEPYGHYKAKISNETLEALKDKDDGKLFW